VRGKYPPPCIYPCTESPLVAEYIALTSKAISEYWLDGDSGMPIQVIMDAVCSKAEKDRFREITMIFDSKADPNEICPCQSNLIYMNCCGALN
jgi:hypothetical protein